MSLDLPCKNGYSFTFGIGDPSEPYRRWPETHPGRGKPTETRAVAATAKILESLVRQRAMVAHEA